MVTTYVNGGPIYSMTLLKAEPGQTVNGKVEMV